VIAGPSTPPEVIGERQRIAMLQMKKIQIDDLERAAARV
jgi:hypothetical protein